MTPLHPCFPEIRIPPEAPHRETQDIDGRAVAESFGRFAEVTDSEVCWEPDTPPQQRIIGEEALPLELRGIISHSGQLSKKRTPKLSQSEFWKLQTTHKFVVASKLRMVGLIEEAQALEDCHSRYTIATCGDCGKVRRFPNRCDRYYCPECANHLQNERTRQVQWWAERIKQPKHVVLTTKRIRDLTPGHVDELRRMFGHLRRRKFCRNWKGGYYGIQITHAKMGWMLHIHALVDARWIDEAELKQQWRSCTNGHGYIVCVRDCRAKDYLRETTRYVVHGAKLAAWKPEVINTFVQAFTGKRTFGVFGNLFGARTEFAEWIATLKQAKPRCDCGSCNVSYQSEADYIIATCIHQPASAPRPPPQPDQQAQLLPAGLAWPD